MQVMTMLAMDRPDSLDGDELRDEKVSPILAAYSSVSELTDSNFA
jgi:glucose-6-phosphate 1-dehydrogenase